MFGPFSAPHSMCLTLIVYVFILIGSAFSSPGMATFASLQPAILPVYAVCFGGITFGVAYWCVLIAIYAGFVTLHAFDVLAPVAIPIFGIPLPAWTFSVITQGLMYAFP
jgi:hypothetical protein